MKGIKNSEFRARIAALIAQRYPSEGPDLIAQETGLSRAAIILRANRAGITQDRKALYERISVTKTELFDTLNLSIWVPTLTSIGAYYLGLIWADGTVWYETPDQAKNRESAYFVQLCLSGEESLLVYDLAKRLHLPEDRVRPHKKYEEQHKDAKVLKLCGKRISSMMIEHYGVYPRKSYIDPEFPKNIPDSLLSSFSRGVYDGDGSGNLYVDNSSTPVYSFHGSKKFIFELWKRMKVQVPELLRDPYQHSQSKDLWLFGVHGPDKVGPLTRWLHNEPSPDYPYAKRKHEPFLKFLSIR